MKRVLVVDDENAMRRLILRALEKEECELTVAGGAEEAIALSQENVYQVLVTDVDLGSGMSGFELARRLREIKQALRVIIMSAEPEHGSRSVSEFDGFLQKPFDLSKLRYLVLQK